MLRVNTSIKHRSTDGVRSLPTGHTTTKFRATLWGNSDHSTVLVDSVSIKHQVTYLPIT